MAAALADNSAAAEKIFEKYLKNIGKIFEILADNSTAAAAVKKYISFKFFILYSFQFYCCCGEISSKIFETCNRPMI